MTKARIAIIGGGLMGAGIAQVFAAAGHEVVVQEPSPKVCATVLDRVREGLAQTGDDPALAGHVKATDQIEEAVHGADFVTEAAPEKLWVKRTIFAKLEKIASPHAILATNTSVMPVGSIAAGLATAHRVIGTHWWNPAPLIPLVEVVEGAATSRAVVEEVMALLASVGKRPAHIKKDVPGFVANRLQHALWREAISMVADGICDARTVDDCVKNSFGLRLAVLGPLENADLVGVDLTRDIHKTVLPELNRDRAPNPLLDQLISQGRLGFKSGEGLQNWTPEAQASLRERLFEHLLTARKNTRG